MLPSEKDSRQNQDLVIQSVRELMGGKYVDPEKFAKEPTSAEAEALRLLDFNTGKFAQNYVEEQKNLDPRIVEAMGVQKEKKEETDMPQMQEGGMLGDLPPEAIANGNVIQGAPVGEVAVPGGGGPVDDGVPTQLPEGTFVLNAASVEYHGTKHINDLIKKSIRNLVKKGVQITGEDLNPDDDVPVAISNGEYIIPPEVTRDIGIKKLEDMNERGLEYRKKIEEQEKQKVSAQDEAMNSFVGAPIQSEQQMPMQDGGEASPPDEAMPKPPEDTSGLNEGQKAVIEAEMLKRRLQQEFFNRETERQRRIMEEDERNRGLIFNEKSGGFDLMAQAQPTPTPFVDTLRRISPDNLDKPRRIMGDPNNPSVPVRQAAFGGQILPQVQSTLAGVGIGANAYPASPQEAFLNAPITGSVLQNLGNAVPLGAMQQPQQQAGFMQPMDQKKNLEPNRLGVNKGGEIDLYVTNLKKDEGFTPVAKKLFGEKKVTVGHGHYGSDYEEGYKMDEVEADKLLRKDILERLPQIKKTIPKFNTFPPELRVRIVNSWFRGGLSGSPTTIRLINEGKYTEAATEFLNHTEFLTEKALGPYKKEQGIPKGERKFGIVDRMAKTAAAIRNQNEIENKPYPIMGDF